jgi:cyclic beta-1,2-glucan synthetase
MFDNLRRSLVAPASFLLFVSALLGSSILWPWILVIFGSMFISSAVNFVAEIVTALHKIPAKQNLISALRDLKVGLERFLFDLTMMPHSSWSHIDAIARALYRLCVSHRKMLEWTTAAQIQSMASLTPRFFVFSFRRDLWLLIPSAILLWAFEPVRFLLAFPFFVLWILAPWIARKASSPPIEKMIQPLDSKDIQLLSQTARKIWRFFHTVVTAEDHYLPPDNLQETPEVEIAHRSSPTNFGLYLLSTMTARDFGWIGTFEMTERLDLTLNSLLNLPRHEGHFYNWYETRDVRALDPKYISAVDNGNLAGHLLALAQGCLDILNRPVPTAQYAKGFLHTLSLFERALQDLPRHPMIERLVHDLKKSIIKFDQLTPFNFARWEEVLKYSDEIYSVVKYEHDHNNTPENTELLSWAHCLVHDAYSVNEDLQGLLSWTVFSPLSFASKPDVQKKWLEIQRRLAVDIPLKYFSTHFEILLHDVMDFQAAFSFSPEHTKALHQLREQLEQTTRSATGLIQKLQEINEISNRLFHEMDFRLLYDSTRKLFSIGYRVTDDELDAGYYDLLASEARLTSFIAISKGDVSPAHWFRLGRGLTPVQKGSALVSWSGSMFEYLMPSLVMETPGGSIIEKTCRLSVERQIEYGSEHRVPWGVSESAYNKRDLHMTYQYSNFGVPDLGLKRGLGADLVIAPYATILASMYDPSAAVKNLRRLQDIDAEGKYGFYEAIDFTPSRLPEGKGHAVVRAYMAHHQGMSLVSIGNVLKNGLMRQRFHSHPLVMSAELLLQERMPRNISSQRPNEKSFQVGLVKEPTETFTRQYHSVNRPVPTTQLLSNGDYTVMLTSSGSGYSQYRGVNINRWREDVTKDNWGSYLFLKDVDTEKIWSATYQPTCVEPDHYDVTFFEDRARFHRLDQNIECELEIVSSPESPAEIRRLTISNKDIQEREIEVTSYFEVVLNSQGADVAHPAFSNLFVQTEYIPDLQTLLATRRARSSKESPLWMAHVLCTEKYTTGEIQYETHRGNFLGRGRDIRHPATIEQNFKLSGTTGNILDPVMSLRTRVRLPAGASTRLTFSTAMANSRQEIISLAEQLLNPTTLQRTTDLAWTHAQVKLHYYNMEPDEAHLFQRLATRLLFLDSSLRPSGEILKRNKKDVTGLWAYGISGDLPIVVVRINDFEERGIVRQLVKAHDYLASKGLAFDLVVLNDQPASYSQELQYSLEHLVQSGRVASQAYHQGRGKIYVLKTEAMPVEDRLLLYSSARAALSGRQGSLSEQVKRTRFYVDKYSFASDRTPAFHRPGGPDLPIPKLQFFNGYGGFSEDGKEYVIVLRHRDQPPAPWINVIANPTFGFQISESGSGYTWSQNSRENQITPWRNDPVSDGPGEAIYILDKESGALWTPTALPIRVENSTYICRHGAGSTSFEHQSHGIYSELTHFVPWDSSVKISMLKLENRGSRTRKLIVSSYTEWALGFGRAAMAMTTITEFDPKTGALFAWNPRSDEFGMRVSFVGIIGGSDSFTADRTEFIGRNGSLEAPGSLYKEGGLSRKCGGGLDPCAAFEKSIELRAGESIETYFFLGQSANRDEAFATVAALQGKNWGESLAEVKSHWDKILNQIEVTTPNPSMDLMLNRWLLYQTTACRFWARAGLYQAGGAYGFRDQLQDVMALMWSQPAIAREHILRAAARQFVEGDVQHWWHPPKGRGVRTHFSDDLLWLPFVVAHYLKITKDFSILEEQVHFLEGPLLRPDQEDSYYTPNISHNSASLFEHCRRALNHSLKTGAHGLPLIGCGDWNDGMNRVGQGGQGESVWLAWFLYVNLQEFARLALRRGEENSAHMWLQKAQDLQKAIEENAWDGEWYRRAYFDNGTPLGSASQSECKIDSLSQTWAVISGAADPARATQAMQAVEKYLIRPEDKMILLFTPPFDKTALDPGYIKGYLPGVRENGGQYTHAAIWCVIAYAMMKEGDKAMNLFSLLNPVQHSATAEEVEKYKVEPYVIAADVYSQAPHTGRGGWTWYTGSCGWMYRAGIESILGLQIHGEEMSFNPCIPKEWPEYKLKYRYGSTDYEVTVRNPQRQPDTVLRLRLDGQEVQEKITMADDGKKHHVEVVLGPRPTMSRQSSLSL